MDTTGSPTPDEPLLADSPPAALSALRDRAHQALAVQRERMQQLESQLSAQLQMVADELATDDAVSPEDPAADALAEAQDALMRERSDWEAEQELANAQRSAQADELSAREQALAAREEEVAAQESDVEARQQEIQEQTAALEDRSAALDQAQAQHASAWQEYQQAEAELELWREQLITEQEGFDQGQSESTHALSEQVAQLEAKLAAQTAEHEADSKTTRQQLTEVNDECDRLRSELKGALADAEAQQQQTAAALEERKHLETAWQEDLAAQKAEHDQLVTSFETLSEELEAHSGWQEERAGLTLQREELAERAEQLRQQLTQQTSAQEKERAALAARNDELTAALDKTNRQLQAAKVAAKGTAQPDEVERKFNLALEDLRLLRERNAELEQELVRRPEQGASESSEVIELREERGALAARLEALESRPPEEAMGDGSEEMSHLQRRFEMAVEDIRELRSKNEALEERLTGAPALAASSGDNAMDWEAQKRRLLASLEDEAGEAVTPERAEERGKIESTIRITDEVVAAKDREMAMLRQQLSQRDVSPTTQAPPEEPHREAIDADTAIQEQRARLVDLEQQMTAQLRQAELEFSTERAKIAREQTELANLRDELNKLSNTLPAGGDGRAGGGKGRWFSKLGLGGDD